MSIFLKKKKKWTYSIITLMIAILTTVEGAPELFGLRTTGYRAESRVGRPEYFFSKHQVTQKSESKDGIEMSGNGGAL